MAASPIAILAENNRQRATGDDTWFKNLGYFFELQIPRSKAVGAGGQTSFLFPLILAPEALSIEEPFTLEATPTAGGGLWVEENGIVQRVLKISGNTGFKPRPLGVTATALGALAPDDRSFARSLRPTVIDKLTGHGHIQYLQDSVFRVYADLKRDPASSEETKLIWHNPKDSEHWLVAPQRFSMRRDKATRTLYHYDIELLILAPASAREKYLSEDRGWLDSVRDAIAMAKSGLAMIEGALTDIDAVVNEVRAFIRDVNTLIESITEIVDAVTDFVQGLQARILLPFSLLESVVEQIDEAMDSVNKLLETTDDVKQMPDMIQQRWRQITDGLERIMSHPASFETKTEKQVREVKERQELLLGASDEAIDLARSRVPAASFAEIETLGTQITPGEVQIAEAELGTGREVLAYTSARNIAITAGDTLVSLAAKHLGDARLWQHIAILNGLQPPYLDEQAASDITDADESPFSGTLGTGSEILIPNYDRSTVQQPLLPLLGVRLEASAAEQLLGRDLALIPQPEQGVAPNRQYDLPVDADLGSVDSRTVAGVDNISQALTLRLLTERGHDQLYQQVGTQRMIGTGEIAVDTEMARFRMAEAVLQDSRISAVRNITFEQQETTLEIDMDVELRGYTDTLSVRTLI